MIDHQNIKISQQTTILSRTGFQKDLLLLSRYNLECVLSVNQLQAHMWVSMTVNDCISHTGSWMSKYWKMFLYLYRQHKTGSDVKWGNTVARVNGLPLERKEWYVKCSSYRQKFQAQALNYCTTNMLQYVQPFWKSGHFFFSISLKT